MDPASPAPVVRAPRGLSRGSRAVIAILAVGVGVPLFLGVWIGSILLLDAAGIALDPDQVLRWLLAGFAGLVLWPVVLHRVRRELWRREGSLLLQSAAVLVVLLLAAPALIVTQRSLARLGPGHPLRARWRERQNWYFSASLAWVISLGVALLSSLAVLLTL